MGFFQKRQNSKNSFLVYYKNGRARAHGVVVRAVVSIPLLSLRSERNSVRSRPPPLSSSLPSWRHLVYVGRSSVTSLLLLSPPPSPAEWRRPAASPTTIPPGPGISARNERRAGDLNTLPLLQTRRDSADAGCASSQGLKLQVKNPPGSSSLEPLSRSLSRDVDWQAWTRMCTVTLIDDSQAS